MKTIALIFLGGGLGSALRYLFSVFGRKFLWDQFPFGTLIANLLSCLIVLLAMLFWLKADDHNALRNFLIIGFCGGLSTFSTFSLETFELFQRGQYISAAVNILISFTAALLIFYFGLKSASSI